MKIYGVKIHKSVTYYAKRNKNIRTISIAPYLYIDSDTVTRKTWKHSELADAP